MKISARLAVYLAALFSAVCLASAATPEARQPAPAKDPFPTYTDRAQVPQLWDGIAEALRNAGLPDAIAAIRVRESAVWTAHVDLKPVQDQPPLRAMVSFDMNAWKIFCVTSEPQGCSKYGR